VPGAGLLGTSGVESGKAAPVAILGALSPHPKIPFPAARPGAESNSTLSEDSGPGPLQFGCWAGEDANWD
jgi:hypothetical protein